MKLKHTNFLRYYDQARLILPFEPYTRTDELPLGQNGNCLKTDKYGNRTEIKWERNGNGTVLPVLLYGRQMEKKNLTPTVHHFITQSIYIITSNNHFTLRKITTILAHLKEISNYNHYSFKSIISYNQLTSCKSRLIKR